MKKVLLSLALVVSATGASFAQVTAPPMVPGNYQTAPQTNCTVGPCWVPFSNTNPLPVTPVSGGTDQDVNIVGLNGTAPSNSNPLFVADGVGATPTDRTITSATGASQQVMAANADRRGLLIQNTGNANCGVNPTGGTAAIGGAGTLTLLPGQAYSPRIPTVSAVTAICTAAQPLYANEN